MCISDKLSLKKWKAFQKKSRQVSIFTKKVKQGENRVDYRRSTCPRFPHGKVDSVNIKIIGTVLECRPRNSLLWSEHIMPKSANNNELTRTTRFASNNIEGKVLLATDEACTT